MNLATTLAFLPLGATVASGQVATALLRETQMLSTGSTVDDLRSVEANEAGGFTVIAVDVIQARGNRSILWGSLDAGLGDVMREEGPIGNLQQDSFLSHRSNLTSVTYGGFSTDTTTGEDLLSSRWLDDQPLGIEGMPAFESGRLWTFLIDLGGITNGGDVAHVAFTSDLSGGDVRNAIYLGTGPTPLLVGGQAVPGLPEPLAKDGDTWLDISAQGTRYITTAEMQSLIPTRRVMIRDGAGLELGGSLVRAGSPIPASVGGLPGDAWGLFQYPGINEAGDFVFTSYVNPMGSETSLVVANGQVIARNGDVLDGLVLKSRVAVKLSEQGDLGMWWEGDSTTPSALFVNGEAVLMDGDAVDWDGDGIPEQGFVVDLRASWVNGSFAIGPDRTIYVVAEVDANGTTLEALLRIEFGVGESYCQAAVNSTGGAATLSASGSDQALDNDLTLFAQGMPLDQFGYFLNSQAQDFVPGVGGSQGNLCLGGAIGRYSGQVFGTGFTGTGLLALDLPNTPTPSGLVAILAGETWNFQAWFRDDDPLPTSNLTNGVQVDFH